ncbi:AurF N-oxygenase family protein [Patulibacter defluvii]|uniref:AurF N-oxygenase family protein n=1 Tax=Patulibacter defluvii TaxID=3095358 RepID=UPI002A755BF3|nr:diiron oxygenase [Patulibacter sp. DM4]
MTATTAPPTRGLDPDYEAMLHTLSEGSVHVHFDPYEDIAWDAPEMAIDPRDPRWILQPAVDPLGATAWYQAQSRERQIEIGRWRVMNAVKVGGSFESILIRGLMHYAMGLPNGSPEFRYCLHEMTEECNHIQMFQELVNRSGADVPGMRPAFKAASPAIGFLGGYLPVILMIGILAGEEPIDHYQKSILREGIEMPPAVLRTMEIHIAEEARHISFAGEFLRLRIPRLSRVERMILSVAFPVIMRWLAGEIMTPPRAFQRRFGIPREVFREAFWDAPRSREIMASYFGDMRALATDVGLMNPVSRRVWRRLGIDGEATRYRGEPDRTATVTR